MDVRPSLTGYVRAVWRRRDLIRALARCRVQSSHRQTYLGSLWGVLSPLLDALVLVVVFGLLLKAGRGVQNVVGFIAIGSFVYGYFQRSVNAGGRAVLANSGLVRSLRFPRAVLPLAEGQAQAVAFLPAALVLAGVTWAFSVGGSGVPTWRWVLAPGAFLTLAVFTQGCALAVSRLVAFTPDAAHVVRFALRVLWFCSGVMFSLPHRLAEIERLPQWVGSVLTYQPIAVYLDLVRACLLTEGSLSFDVIRWIMAFAWAFTALGLGLVFFWRAEARYGRS
jgi:teichoic acid transport system permease protein